jgi:hypothetical protein
VKVVPELAKLTPFIGDAAKAVAKFAEFAAVNPFLGLGAIMAASMTKEIAAAMIGKALEKAIGSSMGSAGLVVGTALITAQLAKLAIDNDIERGNKVHGTAREHATEAEGLAGKIKEGTATPKDILRAKELSSELTADRNNVLNEGVDSGWKSLTKTVGRATGQGEEIDKMEKDEAAAQKAEIKRTDDAMKKLADALAANTAATKDSSGKGGKGGPDAPNRSQPQGAAGRGGTQ